MKSNNSAKIKSVIVKSYFYFIPRYILTFFDLFKILISPKRELTRAYCISPYKTASTYLAGLYSQSSSLHEPLQHATLLFRHNNFFFKSRSAYLSLDLECSGFLSDSLNSIRKISPDAPVLFIFRRFDLWLRSLIDHQFYLSQWQGYPYTSRLFVDKIVGFRVEIFFQQTKAAQTKAVSNLFDYWHKTYIDALCDHNSLIVPIENIDESITEISAFLNLPEPSISKQIWKREAAYNSGFDFSNLIEKSGVSVKQKDFENQFYG
jgi:hypothetical protein